MDVAGNITTPIHGIAGEFENAQELYHAAEKLRDAGFSLWDVYSPYPIHGMNEAMGIGKSWLSAFVFIGGLTGFITAVTLEFFPSSILYPLIVAGKPTNFFTAPAFFPIIFELTILFSAFSAVFGMLALNGLPRWHHPLFNWHRFLKASEDRFFVAIEAKDPLFSEQKIKDLLESIGAKNVTLIHED